MEVLLFRFPILLSGGGVQNMQNSCFPQRNIISPRQISVVVQGPSSSPDGQVLTSLPRVVDSVRFWLPGAELIISTWEGSDSVAALKPDHLILNPDPGGMRYRAGHPFENNINRQIRSSLAGVLQASRPYVLKLRSDLELTGTAFLGAFGSFPQRLDSHRLFEQRVVISTLFTANPGLGGLALFHPGDWVHFGTRSDVLKLWQVPEAVEEDLMRWYERKPVNWQEVEKRFADSPPALQKKVRSAINAMRQLHSEGFACRYAPEQYLWAQALRQAGYEGFQHALDLDVKTLTEAESWLVNNLIVIQARQFAFQSQKYSVSFEDWRPHLYTHLEWCRLYRRITGDKTAAALPNSIWPHLQTYAERRRQRFAVLARSCMARTRRLANKVLIK
jgi:hypothetical protein